MDDRQDKLRVNIDFNSVAEFYDLYVNTAFDVPFWLEVAQQCGGPRLELMCGSGRITLRILDAGMDIDGLDYSERLLRQFRNKLAPSSPKCDLYLADARRFALLKRYRLIFIGFHAIAEVLDNNHKRDVFSCAFTHLVPGGRFWVSAHNPRVRAQTLDGRITDMGQFKLPETNEELQVCGRFVYDPKTGIGSGKQVYTCAREGRSTRTIELPMRFHLVAPDRIDELLCSAGFELVSRYGNYDHAEFSASSSPFYIVEAKRPAC